MSRSIGTTRVQEVMSEAVLTVRPKDKLDAVAKLLDRHDVNAAPVVSESGACIGIITSHDMVEYESIRAEQENHYKRGHGFDLAHYGDARHLLAVKHPIDEVALQMSSKVETTEIDSPLSRAARTMCQKHIHHLVVVDEDKKPIGVLSSLDVLAHMLGEEIGKND